MATGVTFAQSQIQIAYFYTMLKYLRLAAIVFAFNVICARVAMSQSATFDITYGGFSAEAETAFQYAADIWSQYLVSDVPIKVNAKMVFLLPGQLGITFPNGEKNFSGAPYADVWYASCLANSIAGVELNPGENDIDVFVNTSANWYFGTDGNPGPTEYDFVSTVLHELCHGLGFLSLANKTGTEGSFGLIYAESFSPLVTSFPWPDLDTLPGAFDMFLEDGDANDLLNLDNPSDALGTACTSNDIYFSSPLVTDANAGAPARIYAPGTFTLGSSMSHWNEATFPAGNPNELMTPFAGDGNANHDPGALTLAVLEEIGWTINYDTTTSVHVQAPPQIYFYPNPAQSFTTLKGITSAEIIALEIFDMQGRKVLAEMNNMQLNISALSSGIYTIMINTKEQSYERRLVIAK